jgi:hypothetical protein
MGSISRDKFMNKLSNCCGAEVVVEGGETKFYSCTECGRPCDCITSIKIVELVNMGRRAKQFLNRKSLPPNPLGIELNDYIAKAFAKGWQNAMTFVEEMLIENK